MINAPEPAASADPLSAFTQSFALKRAVSYLRVSTRDQAHRGGREEGFSIPAQREANKKKAGALGAMVVKEFVEPGASGTSLNRPKLQEMLNYLETEHPNIDYIIVHKIDRLARNRYDDADLGRKFAEWKIRLISTSENIDQTPGGILLHGIMSSIAEFYSNNLSNEVKKGIAEKVRGGGTTGVAPLGYLNTITRLNGREVRGIAVDSERAPHITWAFNAYATGEYGITRLRDELEARGLKSRTTAKYVAKPLSSAQVHRMLHKAYYIGKVTHKGVTYDGNHEPIVDEATWWQVQNILNTRRIAGDRSWKHDHPFKGTLYCGDCGSRIGYGHAKGRGGTYSYFFCLGRHRGRTSCRLPYLGIEQVEAAVRKLWASRVSFSADVIADIRQHAHTLLHEQQVGARGVAESQTKRLANLKRQKEKLLEAFLAEALPVDDLRAKQDEIAREIADATSLLEASTADQRDLENRLDAVLDLMTDSAQLFDAVSGSNKRVLLQAVFERITVTITDDEAAHDAQDSHAVLASGDLTPAVKVVTDIRTSAPLASGSNSPHFVGNEPEEASVATPGSRDVKPPARFRLPGVPT